MPQEVRRHQQQQGDADRADDAGQLGPAPAASATGVRDELLLMGKP